jgi:Co/Zn/Cd efflux system component
MEDGWPADRREFLGKQVTMSTACCDCIPQSPGAPDPHFRTVLWLVLAINLAMFAVEIGASLIAGSSALQADALDFLADAANYAISLSVVGLGLAWRARAALIKGATMGMFGIGVLAGTLWHAISGTVPHAELMSIIGVTALVANGAVAAMLYRFRTGEANMRSVWICSRNDVIGNLAVLFAAAGVFGTGTGWPDFAVAFVMAGLGISGAWKIMRQASTELATANRPALATIP